MIYQNKTKSQIELEIKKLQEKHTVMKSAKDILQEIGYPSNSQIECYIGYAEAKMRDMKNAIELGWMLFCNQKLLWWGLNYESWIKNSYYSLFSWEFSDPFLNQ